MAQIRRMQQMPTMLPTMGYTVESTVHDAGR